MHVHPERDGHVRAQGRAETRIAVGDSLMFEDDTGMRTPVCIVEIETYGRTVEFLPAAYSGDVILSTSGALERTGWLWAAQ
jgi:hypothetical protein